MPPPLHPKTLNSKSYVALLPPTRPQLQGTAVAVLAFPGAAWSSAVCLCHLPEAAPRLRLPARAPQTSFLRVGVGRARAAGCKQEGLRAQEVGRHACSSAAALALLAPRTALASQAEPCLGVFPMTSGCLPGPRRFGSLWASRVRERCFSVKLQKSDAPDGV